MIITLKGCTATAFISGLNYFNVKQGTVSGADVTIRTSTINKDKATSTSAREIATVALKSNYENLVVTVTMGGATVNWFANGKVTIPANTTVTGDIKISASATAVSGGEVVDPDQPGTGGDSGETPSVPTIYRTDKTLGIQMLEFGDFKFQSNTTTQGASYYCQVVAADVSNYVGKTITISTTHAYIKNNSTYGDAAYCFFLSAAPNGKTPEMLSSVTKLSDLGATSGNQNMDVILDKSIIVERFDVVAEATKDTYVTKSVTVPAGAKYVYFTHTRKGGSDKEANIIFN